MQRRLFALCLTENSFDMHNDSESIKAWPASVYMSIKFYYW